MLSQERPEKQAFGEGGIRTKMVCKREEKGKTDHFRGWNRNLLTKVKDLGRDLSSSWETVG